MLSQDRTFVKEKEPLYERIRQLARRFKGVLCFICGFILSDASLMGGIRPFGVCYAMSLEEETRLWGCLGAFLGSIVIRGGDGVVYAAMCVLTLAIDRFFFDEGRSRELFMPAILAVTIGVLKGPFAFFSGIGALGLLVLECALTAVCSYCLMAESMAGGLRIGRLTVGMLFITAFAGAGIVGLITPSVIAAVILTMAFTYGESGFTGAAFGLVIGALLDMALSKTPFYTSAFGLSAVFGTLCAKKGRISFSLAFLLAGIAVLMWGYPDERAVGCIYDYFIAASIFLLLPDRAGAVSRESISAPYGPAETGYGLKALSRALSAMARTAMERQKDLETGDEDISRVFDDASSEICRSCPKSDLCWLQDYVSVQSSLGDLAPLFKERGFIREKDLRPPLDTGCPKKDRLGGALNTSYSSFMRRRSERARQAESSRVIKEQYAGIKEAADSLAMREDSGFMPRPLEEKQIAAILALYDPQIKAEVYLSCGRLVMRLWGAGEDWVNERQFLRSAELALGKRFLPAERVDYKWGDALMYKEMEALDITAGSCVRKKEGEDACGDSSLFFKTGDGRAVVMLADGMGSGKKASMLSKNALELIAAFIKSGCSMEESTHAVVPFLKARYSCDGFTTLDLLEIDLFSGICRMIKYGASDSYVIKEDDISVISRPSLPPGAFPECPEPETAVFLVSGGTTVVMASDGAGLSAQTITGELSPSKLMETCCDGSDDATVICVAIKKADKDEEKGE